ncbi:MAG: Spy/CpxP family protein refolding chaperone [Phenylobacterium sp.]|uniref:Spy/CpxP family protein refolding chaperone n=1 Tax=Phenylobacterium sp. TaxID=1871053 RepID=UPI002727EA43|nr:Spy/CpxP family protein refolding chaperone [Phenylobacterium sp.]MDO8902621.1 Spy/CpxP family protein refolding chaperone [Phenylobacterium sp.]MDP2213941.1 Spy/CpxP family protein refolding chaperone [Phenylobacterium sp.]
MKTIKTIALSGAIASLAFATAAYAQQPPAPGQGQRPGMEARERPSPEQMRTHMAERLRTTLQLTSQQEAALNTYVGAIAPQPGAWDRRGDRSAMRDMTTPQRLDAMAAQMAQRQQAFATRAEATKRFYAQLTPTQQKAFDALRPAGRGMGMGMGGKSMGGPGGHRGMGHSGR